MKYAAIDVGTNTVLLLIVEIGKAFEEVLDIATITRLGEGLKATNRLSEAAMERTLATLRVYRDTAEKNQAQRIFCVGTAALREAGNSDVFLSRVRENVGLPVRVISARDEAYYTYLSVKHDLAWRGGDFLVIDIGGGSTEIIEGTHEGFGGFVSLPVGSVKLTEMFIRHDPPSPDEIRLVREHIRLLLDLPFAKRGGLLVGTAGTITTLTSIALGVGEYNKERVHGATLSLETINDVITRLAGLTVAERRDLPGMEKGREDILLQGIILLQEVMVHLGVTEVIVNANGVRYGLIYERLDERPDS
ncbi:MAG: Guanosine-5'-triphosphate,3'-diphosphate pyrophosphatase [Syntrophorhabdus sp. PtaU1.Bin153]|nr:MAG: Guanosine-5'-triphosphate,3'-diphosphate pyrophosphatase [Syntrophorhabdus sp. PtaU1.Bin153]